MRLFRHLGRTITERTIDHRTSTEGPSYDPYHVDKWVVDISGQRVELREGIGVTLRVVHGAKSKHAWRKVRVVEQMRETSDPESQRRIYARFQALTGIDRSSLERIYERVHPHFDDPMGSPERYR